MGNFASLKKNDVYSLVLFALYKLRDDPRYSTLSELIYTIDSKNFLKLMETFGGLTITIPTVDEFEQLIYALLVFQRVDVDGEKYRDVVADVSTKTELDMRAIQNDYNRIKEVLSQYKFVRRDKS